MSHEINPRSKSHDLLSVLLGGFAFLALITSPFQVDTSGPYPFYKGALIFPIICLGLMVISSVPSVIRLLKQNPEASWRLDGGGLPKKPMVMLGFLIGFMGGMHFLGLEISVFLFTGTGLYYLGHRTRVRLMGIPLILTGLLYFTFKYMLDVFFPVPVIMDWFLG